MERGETSINVHKLDDICSALEVDINTLLSFDEKQIFNNCRQQGNFGNNNNFVVNTFEKMQELYERMLAAKDLEIELLKEQIKKSNS
jgi:hypothetical protein